MINEERTQELFNYLSTDLSDGSNKKILVTCDYCNHEIQISMKQRNKSNQYCSKDACFNCRYKKREDVSLSKYGVKNYAQKSDVRKKISEKNSNRLKSEAYKKQIKEIMKEKYGADNAMKVPELIKKQKDVLIKKYGVENPIQISGIAKKVAKKSLQTKINRGIIQVVDGKTLPQLAKEQGYSRSHFGKLVRRYGIDHALKQEKHLTYIEELIRSILEKNNICYEFQKTVGKKFPDFVIKELIIECDGLRWHSDIYVEDSYHVNKRKYYNKNGYRVLFFREDEIRDKLSIVESIILNSLNKCNTKYFARKLEFQEIDFKTAFKFIEQNHLMGGVRNVSNSFGLFNENNLVSVLQVRRMKNKDYDISRFCNSLQTSVIGGFSKLLKNFKCKYTPDKIQTFIDLRYGTGDYLPQLGFMQKTCDPSFSWTDGINTYHRLKFRGNSGYEKGLVKIWDCGQAKFEYK